MKQSTLKHLDEFFGRYTQTEYLRGAIEQAVQCIVNLPQANKVLVCGNGGSAADAEHISGEMLKGFLLKRPVKQDLRQKLAQAYADGEFIADNLQEGIKCIPLTSLTSASTAFLNDCNDKLLYAQSVNALAVQGDILIAISTSGNSANVVYAAKLAKVLGVKVIALTGAKGGKLKDIADVLINVPSDETYRIQEYHLPVYHLICMCAESELFDF